MQVNQCVRNANTFAFVGDLEKSPEVSCVYHSEEAENQFVSSWPLFAPELLICHAENLMIACLDAINCGKTLSAAHALHAMQLKAW